MPTADLAGALNAGDTEASNRTFDAIVVGAGAAGGLAANLLCEAGLDVLLLDAGYLPPVWRRPFRRITNTLIRSVADPRLIKVVPPRAINAGRKALRLAGRVRQPIQTQCFAWEQLPDAFVDDRDFPYETPAGQPFNWIRAHGLGGRMIIPGHGRQYYRLGRIDFTPGDGLSPPWPFAEGELDPWYAVVEQRLGLAGARDGIAQPPDSEIARPLSLTSDEKALTDAIKARWPHATPILSRYAPPLDSVGAAAATGRLWCRTGALAQAVTKDAAGRANGVAWHDIKSGSHEIARAPLVFLCASTLESTRILLQSQDPVADPGVLGHYLMDHMMIKAEGVGPKLEDTAEIEPGRCLYLPRFDLRDGKVSGDRGFGVQLYRSDAGDKCWFTAVAFCETTPRVENRVTLDASRRDAYGNPALRIDFRYSSAENDVAKEMAAALTELAGLAGAKLHGLESKPAIPGTSVHECGTARMGTDPTSSVLDSHNACWDVPGLYITDGASFPSQGAQNPTLTIMALTARACHHAVR
ncbi:GMC family oxidoreductase [Hyphomicrobium sp. CS1GBMeth3]|uniref:GMC oxidoreductase n=1 Tax=Hyphomicrobium sp. CS1GBMeth3 TaxID=1892845 RepID=UPI0009F8B552|nr:GMC family oxidoreductase [Hyphomicrobium sp. CS1GBMeth3]